MFPERGPPFLVDTFESLFNLLFTMFIVCVFTISLNCCIEIFHQVKPEDFSLSAYCHRKLSSFWDSTASRRGYRGDQSAEQHQSSGGAINLQDVAGAAEEGYSSRADVDDRRRPPKNGRDREDLPFLGGRRDDLQEHEDRDRPLLGFTQDRTDQEWVLLSRPAGGVKLRRGGGPPTRSEPARRGDGGGSGGTNGAGWWQGVEVDLGGVRDDSSRKPLPCGWARSCQGEGEGVPGTELLSRI